MVGVKGSPVNTRCPPAVLIPYGASPPRKSINDGALMKTLRQDLRYAARMLLKSPGFTLAAVLTLALGIGATSAVFSLIHGVLLSPPPYRRPERLVLVQPVRTDRQQLLNNQGWAAAQWMDWQANSSSFDSIVGYDWSFNFLVLDDGSESLEGMWVTRDYFQVTGLQPILGRAFTESDGAPNAPPVIILGYDLWQRRFGGDHDIVGKAIRISRWQTPPTIIGVMPPGIRFLPSPTTAAEPNYDVNAQVDFWIPAIPNPARLKNPGWNVAGRLKDGATLARAQAELATLTGAEAQADRAFEGVTPQVQLLNEEMNRDGRRILLPLMGAAALVLLIACGNAAALLLVRGLQRQQEYAVRCALGAPRAALFQQVSVESLLLSLLGGSLGVGLAFGIVKVFKLIGRHAIPRLDSVSAGWPVLLCGLAAAVFAAALAGLLPAMRASLMDPMAVIKGGGPKSSAGRGERRLLGGVVTAQTALTLALLVGAGLLIRTMNNLANVQTGYDTGHILTMSVTAVQGKWMDFHRQALDRVARLPGVQHAAFAWGVPLTGNSWPATVQIEGQPVPDKESDQLLLPLRAVTEDYFNLMGLGISEGREFRSTDIGGAPGVAIVNQTLVDRYFPNQEPVGKKLWLQGPQQPPTAIIGVMSDGRTDDLTQAAAPEIYLPLWQATAFSKHLVVRAAGDPRSLLVAVQRELRSIDSTVAIENVKTLEQIRGDSVASRTFATQLLAGFSGVASLLTLVGIYGVLSLSVTARQRDIAIRIAVGAERWDILRKVLGEGMRLIAIGVLAGAVAAIALSRIFSSFLFEVQPTDPVTLISVGLLFALVALLACCLPARRAARVDPMEALRYE